jgi:hypothetical protein
VHPASFERRLNYGFRVLIDELDLPLALAWDAAGRQPVLRREPKETNCVIVAFQKTPKTCDFFAHRATWREVTTAYDESERRRRKSAASGERGAGKRSGSPYTLSLSHDQCGMLRPFGTSSADWW